MNYSLPGSSLFMGFFSGNNIGVGCHFPPPGNLPDPGIEPLSPSSPELQADSLPAEKSGKPHGTWAQTQSSLKLGMGFQGVCLPSQARVPSLRCSLM